MVPHWLHLLAIASLGLGALCAILIGIDVARHPQHMWIIDIVWPVTALFGTVWILWQYFSYGRLGPHENANKPKRATKTLQTSV